MKKLHLIFTGILLSSLALGQTQFTLYQLNSRLPQANQINPALIPEYKLTIGLPGISSGYWSVNTGKLTFDNALTRLPDDSLQFDPSKLLSKLDKYNRIEFNANTQLFHLGIKANKNYFSLAINGRAEGAFTYPKTFIELLAAGNGDYIGREMRFDNLGAKAQLYHEIALGYGRDISSKLTVGGRLKFLAGIAGADLEKFGASFTTNYDSLFLQTDQVNLYTSGTSMFEDEEVDIVDALLNFNNKGFALDLGAQFRVNDDIQLSAAVNDLGYINWSDDIQQIQIDANNYAFYGIDLLDIIDSNTEADPFEQLADTLQVMFEPDTLSSSGFTSNLSPKVYLGGTYQLGKFHTFGATFYGDFIKGTFNPAFGLSYNIELGQIWTVGLNASFRNNTINNIGIGTALTLGPIQLYALTERITSLTNPYNANLLDARAGMNIVIGKKGKSKKIKNIDEPEDYMDNHEIIPDIELSEPVTTAVRGNDKDELSNGFYLVIASFKNQNDAEKYCNELHNEGYAALNGYQSELAEYYAYLMYFPQDGNEAIKKKNELKKSLAPGMNDPWVLWVQSEPK